MTALVRGRPDVDGQVGAVLPWPAASRLSHLPHPAASAGPPGGTSSPLCQVSGK